MKGKSAESEMAEIIRRLKKRYSKQLRTALYHSNAWELLVATMLSAQAQDAQVNKITPALFKQYPKPADYVNLTPRQLYPFVGSIGLFRTKSKNIIGAARYIENNFGGKVPNSMEKLVMLPGVGRKTANVVLGNYFGIHDGIAIDTHCITVSNRLFLYGTKNPAIIEKRLMQRVPRAEWSNINNLFIALGRDVCTARKKLCGRCVLRDLCPSAEPDGE